MRGQRAVPAALICSGWENNSGGVQSASHRGKAGAPGSVSTHLSTFFTKRGSLLRVSTWQLLRSG